MYDSYDMNGIRLSEGSSDEAPETLWGASDWFKGIMRNYRTEAGGAMKEAEALFNEYLNDPEYADDREMQAFGKEFKVMKVMYNTFDRLGSFVQTGIDTAAFILEGKKPQ